MQYRLLRQIAPASGNICAIGDPDQSIYKFRGADVGFFLRFREDFPAARTVELDRNYRSQPAIVEAAKMVVAPGTLLPGRRLEAASGKPASPLVLLEGDDERGEACAGGAGDRAAARRPFALRARQRADRRPGIIRPSPAGFVRRHRDPLPHQRPGGALRGGARPAGHPLPAALARKADRTRRGALDAPPPDPPARPGRHGPRRRRLAAPGRRGGAARRRPGERRAQRGQARGGAPAAGAAGPETGADLDAFLGDLATGAEVDTWDPRAERVSLLTLHAAKGLEFPVVFLAGCDDDLLPFRFFGDDQDVERGAPALLRRGHPRPGPALPLARPAPHLPGRNPQDRAFAVSGGHPAKLFEKQAPPPRAPKKVEPVVQQLGLFVDPS